MSFISRPSGRVDRNMRKRGKIVVLSGPSGVGKTTICKALCQRIPHLRWSVSWTTRAKRMDETEGKDYHFVSKEEFLQAIAQDGFLEYALVHDNYYGTPKKELEAVLDAGDHCLLEIDVQGGRNIQKQTQYESVLLFIAPPNLQTLGQRLEGRNTDSLTVIEKRLKNAKKELEEAKFYNHIVINHDLEKTIAEIQTILEKT